MTEHERLAGGIPAAAPTDGHETDEALLAGLVGGRLDALDRLYDRYRTMAFSIALRITNDGTLAEDVVQDAFLGAWRNAARYAEARGSVRTWLLSIVHHRAIDAVRRRRPTSELPDAAESAPPAELTLPDLWPEIAARIDRETVRTALAALSDVQREAIELAYFSGLTQVEIAERTNTPLGTVKSRVRLGLLTMRRVIVGEDPSLGEAQP
jgi:RNA polymerase sigma-70 factor (ECF subfamily)